MNETFKIRVNGAAHIIHAAPDTLLLYILRNDLALNGPKFGCGLGQCGACMVLVDGSAAPSCRLELNAVRDAEIITLEGLATKEGKLHKVQQAFVDEQAAQCGYCLNGLVIAAVGLLNRNTNPSDDEIRSQLYVNICRCGIHARAIKAIKKVVNP